MTADKPALVLLHGALSDKNQFEYLAPKLKDIFNVHTLSFEGHGYSGGIDRPFRIEYFAENVLNYLNQNAIEKANIFGYSMGGYVALTLVKNHPGRIGKVATLGTVLKWNEEKAAQECGYLQPDKIIDKVPKFAKKLEKQHQYGWKVMVNKTREMLHDLGRNATLTDGDWENIRHSIRLHVGDRDTTAGLETTVKIYRKIENAQLAVLPHTPHSFEKVDMKKLTKSCLAYF